MKTLSRFALALSGLGTIVIIISTITKLAQQGFTRELGLALGGLSLTALGVIILVVAAYVQRKLEFNYFTTLMVAVLALISIAFLILSRAISP
jgi:hypothetical protein